MSGETSDRRARLLGKATVDLADEPSSVVVWRALR